ncbi:hypothetical protein HON36_01555 [Candidatus Parcubacteria bacterium]|jgi:hypothetical protein|nr:hypothetical protein [Candidatus Parcubacteria bacterium]MBT7228131.1 hypothetical protein [Candidatus Parcubacteria bacterium]
MVIKHHKIFIHDHLNSRELSETYISSQTENGRIFVILEVPKHKTDQQPVIDEIINEIATSFETANDGDPEGILEQILQNINQLLPKLSTDIKIRNWLNTLDLAIGIFHDDNVFLAGIGNINALLIHHNKITPVINKQSNINPNKIFSDIISGQLDAGDVLVVSTNALFDYISQEKIRQTVKQYSPQAAVIKINELLNTVPDFVTFNSVIVKNPSPADMEITPEEVQPLDYGDEDEIDETITPQKDDGYKGTITKPKTKLVVDLGAVKNIGSIKKMKKSFSYVGYFFSLLKRFFVYIFTKIKNAFLFVFSSKHRNQSEQQTIDNIKDITDKKLNWWQALNIKKRIIIGVLFIIILVFLQSLVFLTQKKSDNQKDEAYNTTLLEIQNKYEEVDAKLIYEDDEAAEALLLEITALIKNIKPSNAEQKTKITEMSEHVFYELNKVRRIHVVTAPVELFNLSDTVLSTDNIVQKDGVFYILSDSIIYTIKDNLLTEVANLHGGQTITAMTDLPDTNQVVLSSINANNELYYQVFDLDTGSSVGSLKQTAANTQVQDMAVYGGNLYVLDPSNNQVFKYPEKGQSFSGGQVWLQEELNIMDSTSLTIDGSIYMIENNGNIRNFLKGVEEKFDYHTPNPPIGSNATIKTFRDSDYLYIIDPQNNRIIILDKEGNIKDQYTSQKFDNLTDLAIDPDEKAIFLLNGNHLYILAINE